jgi:tetratricopeptide (TPR) repeat protein
MRATVLTDRALAKHAGRFVWLSIDTEDSKNAAFLDRYPWSAIPTFQVIDPATKRIAYSWIGAVDATELARRFDEAERAYHDPAATTAASPDSPDSAIVEASVAGKNEECAKRALDLWPTLPPGAVKANVAATGLDCALSAPSDAAWKPEAVQKLEAAVKEALNFPDLLDDDRSALYGSLVDARDRQNDEAGGTAAAVAWLDWLDRQTRTAPSAEARAALDGYRVSASIRAKTPERVLASIEASERDLPNDYNPPARLALVLREMGRYDEALAASDRALAKVYGPRTLTILDARATIFEKKGDRASAKEALTRALAYAATLPKPQRSAGMIARLQKHIDTL